MRRYGCLRLFMIGLSILVVLLLAAAGLAAWDNSRLPARSTVADRLSEQDKARLIEAQHLLRSVGDEVLPGWGQAEIPLILYNEAYAFLTGTGGPPPDGWGHARTGQLYGTAWEAVPGEDFQGKPYYRQALFDGVAPQAFTVRIGEGYAASLTTLDYSRTYMRGRFRESLPGFLEPVFPYRLATGLVLGNTDQYITYILHEAAHAYQGILTSDRLAAGEQANIDFENAYPWEDESLRADWQSELDTLALALRAETDEETRTLAREFLQIRRSRRQSAGLSADLAGFERHREWVEGIARYAEIEVYRLAWENPAYRPTEGITADPDFRGYEKYEQRWAREIDQMKRMAGDGDETRFYYTGMAQAVLLDRLDPAWKARLFEPGIWLEDLLAEAVE